MLSPPTQPDASPNLRDAMRQLAGGVSIVTAGAGAARAGFTVTSVTSLTLEPPCLLVCVNRSVSALPTLQREGRFCINILADRHRALAIRFSGVTGVRGTERFDDGDWDLGPHGTPVLADALAAVECDIDDVVERHSHLIFIGAARSVQTTDAGVPLVYVHGDYGRFFGL